MNSKKETLRKLNEKGYVHQNDLIELNDIIKNIEVHQEEELKPLKRSLRASMPFGELKDMLRLI